MRATVLACLTLIALASAAVSADDYVVLVDDEVQFSTLRTFMVSDVRTASTHSELDSLVLRNVLRAAVGKALTERGLSETSTQPALIVECLVRGVDFGIDRMGRPIEQRGGGRGARRQPKLNPRQFIEGTLVIDVLRAGTRELVWRGVYHDTDDEPAAVAAAMPKHAGKLLSGFPRLRKP